MGQRPVVLRPADAAHYDFGDPTTIDVRVTAEDSNGALTVFEVSGDVTRDVSQARLHLHEGFTEVFYVLEGEVDFVSGEAEPALGLGPGSIVVVPPGVPHGLAPSGRWRHATFVMPGGFDRYFAEVAAAIEADGPAADRATISARYGTHPVRR
jgi:mannose-6-phosphate isomerase-like protein (cupin superfamily)